MTLETIVQRALDRARHYTLSPSQFGRASLACGIAAGLLVSALGPAAPVHADPSPDPAARLGFVINSLYVRDDRDWFGKGELRFNAHLCTAVSSTACGPGPRIE